MAHAEEVLWHFDKTRDIRVVYSTNLGKRNYRWVQRMEATTVRLETDGEDVVYEESQWIGEGCLVKNRNTPKEIGWTEECVQGKRRRSFSGSDLTAQ